MLVKTIKACLNVIFCEIGIEGHLPPGIGRSAMVGRGGGRIVWGAIEIGSVVVIEGRDGQQCFRVKCMDPGKVHKGIAFMLAVAQPDAWVLATGWCVLDVVRV